MTKTLFVAAGVGDFAYKAAVATTLLAMAFGWITFATGMLMLAALFGSSMLLGLALAGALVAA
jgi:hypothetical protein